MIDSRLTVFAMVSIIGCFYSGSFHRPSPRPTLSRFFFHAYTRSSTTKYNRSSIKVPIGPFGDPVSVMRIEIPPLPLFFFLPVRWQHAWLSINNSRTPIYQSCRAAQLIDPLSILRHSSSVLPSRIVTGSSHFHTTVFADSRASLGKGKRGESVARPKRKLPITRGSRADREQSSVIRPKIEQPSLV